LAKQGLSAAGLPATSFWSAMIGRLNHVAIVVPDLEAARALYRDTLGARVSKAVDMPAHGVTTVFVELPNTKIELLHPLGEDSPVAAFLARNPSGGMHHLCFEVDDILAARDRLETQGARVLGDGEPRIGAHDKPVLFLHPKDFCGTLIEIEQA
jgi:methylmalonyl-CoA/ethylmalonyl-CoA epimerase